MKKRNEFILYFLLMLLTFACSNGNNTNMDVKIYNKIMPLLIQNEYLLQKHIPPPPPPPIESDTSDTIQINRINVIEDSLRKEHQNRWKTYFDSVDIVVVVHDTLMGSKTINSFINLSNDFLIDEEYNKAYNQLVNGELKSKRVNINDIKIPERISFIDKASGIDNDTTKYLIGYLSLSRISLNEEQNKGCFFLDFKSKNKLQGFEMFVLIDKKENNWKILKTTRD